MTTITGQIEAWIPEYVSPDQLHGERALHYMTFADCDMSGHGYSRAGVATVSVEIADKDDLIANKVDALRSQVQKVRADAQMEANRIEDKIQQLLAITNEVTA